MNCPCCGAELEHYDSYGRLAVHQDGTVLGEILKCPVGAEEGDCESAVFHVAGSYYTDAQGNLHEGYPC